MRLPKQLAVAALLGAVGLADTSIAAARDGDPLEILPYSILRQFRAGTALEQILGAARYPVQTYDLDGDGLDIEDVETAEVFGRAAQRARFVELTLAFDLDGDLKVTDAEALAAAERQFQSLGKAMVAKRLVEIMSPDRDKDGTVSIEEMASQEPLPSQRRREEDLREMLHLDPDGDGHLQPAELEASIRTGFAKLDLNGDGFLDRAEVPVPIAP